MIYQAPLISQQVSEVQIIAVKKTTLFLLYLLDVYIPPFFKEISVIERQMFHIYPHNNSVEQREVLAQSHPNISCIVQT